jgi:hypothetical protein
MSNKNNGGNMNWRNNGGSNSNVPSGGIIVASNKFSMTCGINDYPGTSNDLQGCVNDAIGWADVLIKRGFKNVLLKDSQVTREAFVQTFGNYVADAKSGASIVITNSSHGTSLPDTNNDEPDGKDEAFCMYNGYLRDDDIRGIIKNLADGVNLTIISDSCFSGSVTRSFLSSIRNSHPPVPRFMPPSDNICAARLNVLPVRNRVFFDEGEMKEILISGCKDNEYSYDAYLGGSYQGAMSYYAKKVINENGPITYRKFYNQLRSYLPHNNYPQTPLLEGKEENKDKIMFI